MAPAFGLIVSLLTLVAALAGTAGAQPLPPPQPRLVISAGGAVGEVTRFDVNHLTGGAPFVVAVSAGRSYYSQLGLQAPIFPLGIGQLDAMGAGDIKRTVPNVTALVGAQLWTQAAVGPVFLNYSNVVRWVIAHPAAQRLTVLNPAAMPVSRATMTPLANGRFAFTGGFALSTISVPIPMPVATVDEYDPVLNRLQRRGAMTTVRAGHVAIELPNRRLLIGGGTGNTRSAELFDLATGQAQSIGLAPYGFHADTPMTIVTDQGSRTDYALILGGGYGAVSRDASVYDVQRNLLRPTSPMAVAAAGRALITIPQTSLAVVSGGQDGASNAIDTIEIYDASQGTFTTAGRLVIARFGHAMHALGRSLVFIAGGRDSSGRRVLRTELFDLRTGRSALQPFQPYAGRDDGTFVTRRGGDLVVGDRTGLESLTGYGVRPLRPIADTGVDTIGVGPGGAVLLRGFQAMHYMR